MSLKVNYLDGKCVQFFLVCLDFLSTFYHLHRSFVFETAVPEHIKQQIAVGVLGAEWWLPVRLF
jgi:hypothetical protein